MDELTGLQKWYLEQCDGEWEEPEPATADIHRRQGFHTPPTVPWREDHDQTA